MKLEVGDKIYCHTTGKMNGDGVVYAIEGRWYELVSPMPSYDNYIAFFDEMGDRHHWDYENDPTFPKYFSVGCGIEPIMSISEHNFINM